MNQPCTLLTSCVRSSLCTVTPGQRIEYVLMAKAREHHAAKGQPPEMKLEWEYTDEHLAICVKPRGVAVQGDASANRRR